jgi:hypothetical protein
VCAKNIRRSAAVAAAAARGPIPEASQHVHDFVNELVQGQNGTGGNNFHSVAAAATTTPARRPNFVCACVRASVRACVDSANLIRR